MTHTDPPAKGPPALTVRPATEDDFGSIWAIFSEVLAGGDTFLADEAMGPDVARDMWLGEGVTTFVGCAGGAVVGAYKLYPNYPGRGAHVCQGSYVVDAQHRGLGVGRGLVAHSLDTARDQGFRDIQFNFVVSTNTGAVHLYEDMGFTVVGTLPGAFRHRTRGYVDAFVMHRPLAA